MKKKIASVSLLTLALLAGYGFPGAQAGDQAVFSPASSPKSRQASDEGSLNLKLLGGIEQRYFHIFFGQIWQEANNSPLPALTSSPASPQPEETLPYPAFFTAAEAPLSPQQKKILQENPPAWVDFVIRKEKPSLTEGLQAASSFTLKKIDLIDPEKRINVQALLAEFKGEPITSELIYHILNAISVQLTAQGYLSSFPVLPSGQNIGSGVLRVKVVYGRINKWVLLNKPKQNYFLPNMKNDILNIHNIDAEVYNFNMLGEGLYTKISPARKDGYSNLDAFIYSQQRGNLTIGVNNSGSGTASNGLYQGTINGTIYRPVFGNDLLNFGVSGFYYRHLRKSSNYNFNGEYKIYYRRFYVDLTTDYNKYSQYITGMYGNYSSSGSTLSYGVQGGYTYRRTQNSTSSVYFELQNKKNNNYFDQVELPVDSQDYSSATLGYERNKFLGSSLYTVNLSVATGLPIFGSEGAANINGTPGFKEYVTFNGLLNYSKSFNIWHFPAQYQNTTSFQVADARLVPGFQFSVGGQYSVRGYANATSQYRDNGFYFSNTLYVTLFNQYNLTIQPLVGLDYGFLFNTGAQDNALSMAGAAVGTNLDFHNFNTSVTWGVPIDSKIAGAMPVLYFQAGYTFNF